MPKLKPDYLYDATVVKVVDGDTVDLDVDLGFWVTLRVRVRLAGVNAPEIRGPEKELGLLAADFLRSILPAVAVVALRSLGVEKYGRCLGVILLEDGRSVADLLICSGHARPSK